MTLRTVQRPLTAFGIAALLIGAAGCMQSADAPASPVVVTDNAAIQGGSTTTDYNFALGIVIHVSGGMGSCSGSLIAPNLVLTARHCVSPTSTGERMNCSTTFGPAAAARNFYVTTDAQMSQTSDFIPAAHIDVPSDDTACGNDIALIRLSENIPNVKLAVPAVQHKIYNATRYSRTVAAVGYGLTSALPTAQDSGTRRIKRAIPILCTDGSSHLPACGVQAPEALGVNDIVTGPGTCQGDSGSGAYDDTTLDGDTPTVLGVLSRGGSNPQTGECMEAIYTRVDGQADFIIQGALAAATAGGYAAPSWTQSVPQDPEDTASAGTTTGTTTKSAQGEKCAKRTDCQGSIAQCVDFGDGRGNVCANSCTTTCNDGFTCNGGYCQKESAAPTEPTTGAADAGSASGSGNLTVSTSRSGGCSTQGVDPTHPQPWYAGAMLIGAVFFGRRRRS